jgi:hypothetical protein
VAGLRLTGEADAGTTLYRTSIKEKEKSDTNQLSQVRRVGIPAVSCLSLVDHIGGVNEMVPYFLPAAKTG